MSLFRHCKHKWIEIRKTACPGLLSLKNASCSAEEARKLMSGSVTYLFQCSLCSKMRQEEMIGQEKQP